MVEMIIRCLLTPRLLFVKSTFLTEVMAHFRDPLLCLRAFGNRSSSLREPILVTSRTVHHLLCPTCGPLAVIHSKKRPNAEALGR